MNPVFRINLARDYVDSRKRRRLLYLGVHLHILVCGLLMVGIAYLSTDKLVAIQNDRREIENIRAQFRKTYPENDDMGAYVDALKTQLVVSEEVMDSVADILQERVDLAQVLLGLAHPVYDVGSLSRFEWRRDKGELLFDIHAYVQSGRSGVTARDLISLWQDDPVLVKRVKDISSLSTERDVAGSRVTMVFSFVCTLADASANQGQE